MLNADQMRAAVKAGEAMPAPGEGRPGRFQVRNRSELEDAIRAVGRAGGPNGTEADRAAVRRFILRRAMKLDLLNLIPASWNADGSLKS